MSLRLLFYIIEFLLGPEALREIISDANWVPVIPSTTPHAIPNAAANDGYHPSQRDNVGQSRPTQGGCPCDSPYKRQKRITHGLSLHPEEENHPWACALKDDKGGVYCTGSIISPKFVLTAHHCTMADGKRGPNRFCDYSGDRKYVCSLLSSEIFVSPHLKEYEMQPLATVPVRAIHREPSEHIETFTYDIAILELSESLPCRQASRPACLPIAPIVPGAHVSVVGYGKTGNTLEDNVHVLREANLVVAHPSECANVAFFNFNKICTIGKDGSNVCWGDSGAGLVSIQNKVHTVVGVVSTSACDFNGTSVFIDVYQSLKWIKSVTGI